MANGHGGLRPNSGRPTKADEEKVRNLAVGAIEKTYGSIEAGFQHLLASDEPALIKFVWEHGVGKPREKMDVNSDQPLVPSFIVNIGRPNTDNSNAGI